MICPRCKGQHNDARYGGHCSRSCEHRHGQMVQAEVNIDWFDVRFRAFVIRECWPPRERQARTRVDWRRKAVEMREICVDELETVA